MDGRQENPRTKTSTTSQTKPWRVKFAVRPSTDILDLTPTHATPRRLASAGSSQGQSSRTVQEIPQ